METGNKIGPGGAKALASVLGENRVLTVLELEGAPPAERANTQRNHADEDVEHFVMQSYPCVSAGLVCRVFL